MQTCMMFLLLTSEVGESVGFDVGLFVLGLSEGGALGLDVGYNHQILH